MSGQARTRRAKPRRRSVTADDDQKKEFIEVTNRLKLLTDRRAQILARVGDEYVMAPPKLASETVKRRRCRCQNRREPRAQQKRAVQRLIGRGAGRR